MNDLENREMFVYYLKKLLEYKGYNESIETIDIINVLSSKSKTFFDFLNKLKIEYSISREIKNIPGLLIDNQNSFYLVIIEEDNIYLIDSKKKKIKFEEGNFKDYIVINITELNDCHLKILKKSFYRFKICSFINKYKLYSFCFIFVEIIKVILFYFISVFVRTTIDVYLKYKNHNVIMMILILIIVMFGCLLILDKVNKLIISKLEYKIKNKYNCLCDNYISFLIAFFRFLSHPIIIVLLIYCMSYLNIQLYFYSIISSICIVLFEYIIYYIFNIRNNKNLNLINNRNIVSNIICNIFYFIIIGYFIYLSICVYFIDDISLGIIFMGLLMYTYMEYYFYNGIFKIQRIRKSLTIFEYIKFKDMITEITVERKNYLNNNFSIYISTIKFSNCTSFKNIELKNNTINLIIGKSKTGKTLFGKTLIGVYKDNMSNIYFNEISISFFKTNELKEMVFYLNNENLVNNTQLILKNSNSDIKHIFNSLGINNLLNRIAYLNEISDSEKILFGIARAILSNRYVIIIDNVLCRLDNNQINRVINLCKSLQLLVIILEVENKFNIAYDQCIDLSKGKVVINNEII